MEDPPCSRSCLPLRPVSMERLSLYALVLTLVDVRILGVLLHAAHETSSAAATALLLVVVVALALVVVVALVLVVVVALVLVVVVALVLVIVVALVLVVVVALVLVVVVALVLVVVTTIHHLLALLEDVFHVVRFRDWVACSFRVDAV
jgi:hypothetical protein